MATSRKRAIEDNDEELFFKRSRLLDTNNVESRLRGLIATVCGAHTSSLESNLERLAHILTVEQDVFNERLLTLLPQCVCFLPDKMTVFSTLLGLLNKMNFSFGGEMLEKVLEKLELKLESDNYDHALRLIVFLANVVNSRVISVSSFIRFLEGIMETALEEGIPQVRSDWFIYALLRCLPYVGRELYENDKDALDNILMQVAEYIAKRKKDYLKLLQVWSASPHEQEEYLDCLWAQISKLREDEWKEKHILHYYVAFDGTLADAQQHNIRSFSAPHHSPGKAYPLPTVVFRLFDYADCPEEGPLLPGAHSIERFLIEEDIRWIIEQNIWNRRECAMELLDYQKRHAVPINYMALEVIFSQLFRLPEPPTKPIFYGSLLIELCKVHPSSMPQVIAQAAELFYQRLDSMHFSAVDQLVDWFSYHMANFEYRWSWAEWDDCLELDDLSPKHFFMREVLEKCVRLSYHQRIKHCLPESFHRVMPPVPSICCEFENEEEPVSVLAMLLSDLIKNKITPEELTETVTGREVEDYSEDVVLSTLVAVLLSLSKKTISYTFAALTRYLKTLKQLVGSSEESQMTVLKGLYSVWKHNHQMMCVIANKMVTMTIVDSSAIVAWIFSDEMKFEFERLWTWELLGDAVEHVSGHLRRCRIKLEEVRKRNNAKREEVIKRGAEAKVSPSPENSDADKDSSDDSKDEDEMNQEDENSLEIEIDDLREYLENLLLDILHKFTVKLTEYIVVCDSKGKDFNTSWYKYFTDRFRGFFLKNWREMFEFSETIEKKLFKAQAIDAQVMESYTMFVSLGS
uniref:Nuclear cap-binding protein subunit 1 n=1 Tax=Ascaris lumbricoides TaxID=6252 RepID=A0A9J2PE73_ASCLU